MALWCFDFGHGGKDVGAVNGNRYEKNDVVILGNKIIAILEKHGEKVMLSRKGDEYVSTIERCNRANNARADYFISIHRNSAKDKGALGLETFSCRGAVKAKILALEVQNNILKKVKFENRGIKEKNFDVLYYTKMSAILLEVGFISNDVDNSLFDKNIDIIANQIAEACLKEVGKSINNINIPVNNGEVFYRVVCGSFKDRKNAEDRKKLIEEKTGLEVFLVAEKV